MWQCVTDHILFIVAGFLEACKEGNPSDLFAAYKISDWGKDLKVADVVDFAKSKPTKSAAVRAAEARAGK